MDQNTIEKLKKRHGDIWLVEVTIDDQVHEFVLRRADRKTLAASARFSESDPMQATEIIIKNSVVHGDEKLLDDVRIIQALGDKVGMINQPPPSRIKKL